MRCAVSCATASITDGCGCAGSAAFVVGALACGLLADVMSGEQADLGDRRARCALRRSPVLCCRGWTGQRQARPARAGHRALLRDPGFLAIIVAAALIQGSHAAYYTFASITWQAQGLGGLTIAGLWVLGVLAEIVVFALSSRLRLQPATMLLIGAVAAVLRWLMTAQEPQVAVLACVQMAHGLTFGLTQVGTMGLLVRHVPAHVMARGQGYLAACSGIIGSSASILSGAIYARYGQGVYYLMAVMAGSGGLLIWLARRRLSAFGIIPTARLRRIDDAAVIAQPVIAIARQQQRDRRDRRSGPAVSAASQAPSTARSPTMQPTMMSKPSARAASAMASASVSPPVLSSLMLTAS